MSILPFFPDCDAAVVPPTPTAGLFITIAGTDRSSYYKSKSLKISETLGNRSTCQFSIYDSTGSLSCPIGSEVTVVLDGETVFSGTIEKTQKKFPSMDYADTPMVMSIRCVDWNQVLDRKLVSRVYRSNKQSFGTIVRLIVRDFLADEGIVAGQIMNGAETDYLSFQFETITSCLQTMASAVGYVFYVDYNKQLHFRDRIDVAAPFNLDASSPNFRSAVISESRSQYRNRQYLRGGLEPSPNARVESFAGNNEDRSFDLAMPLGAEPEVWVRRGEPLSHGGESDDTIPLDERPDIWAVEEGPEDLRHNPGGGVGRLQLVDGGSPDFRWDIQELTIAGSPWEKQTVGTGEQGEVAQWAWSFGERTITQNSDEVALRTYAYHLLTDAEIDAGFTPLLESLISDTVRIIYRPLVRIVARSEDTAEIASRAAAEGGSGIYEAVEEDERIEDSRFAQAKVEGLLSQLGRIPTTATIETDEPGIRAGQLQTLTLSKLGLSGSYLIQSFSASDRGDETLRYRYKALDGESLGGWQDFFRRLVNQGRKFVATEGEAVMVFGQGEDAVTLTDNLPTPDTSNTLGAYTTDAYTVCLVGAGSAIGESYPTNKTYEEHLKDSYPIVYYRLDGVGSFTGQASPVADSSGSFNGGSSFFLGMTSPGAVGEDSTPGTTSPSFCAFFPAAMAGMRPRINVPSSALNNQSDLTFGFWILPTENSQEMTLFNGGTAADLSNIRLEIDANATPTIAGTDEISVHYYDTTASTTRTVTWTGLTLRTAFTHIALVRNQSEQSFTLYLDGVNRGVHPNNSIGETIAMTNLDIDGFVIGQKFNTNLISFANLKYYTGKMDEFAIFPSVLSAVTIASHAKDRPVMYHVGSHLPPGPVVRERDDLPEQPTYEGL